jgi:hypothetical protein
MYSWKNDIPRLLLHYCANPYRLLLQFTIHRVGRMKVPVNEE